MEDEQFSLTLSSDHDRNAMMSVDLDNPPPMIYSTDTNDDDYELGHVNLKILQRNSDEVESEEGRPGQIYLEGVGVVDAPLVMVPLGRAQSRILKKDKRNITSDIVCRSSDAFFGYGEPGGQCSSCPYSRGSAEDTPDCTHIITYLVYLPDEDVIARINFQRTSLRAARRINTLLRGKRMGDVAIELTTRQTGSEGMRYYTPNVKKGEVPADAVIPVL